MRRLTLLTFAAALAITACGGGSDSADDGAAAATEVVTGGGDEPPADAPEAPTERPEAPDSPISIETDPPVSIEEISDEIPQDGADPLPADATAVTLSEWLVDMPAELPPGATTFAVANGGEFPHHFAAARGNSYEELPLLDNGAIDEAALGADFLGQTENIASGSSDSIEFELEAGNYVFFCNIVAGPTSHAARGQVLSVTVS